MAQTTDRLSTFMVGWQTYNPTSSKPSLLTPMKMSNFPEDFNLLQIMLAKTQLLSLPPEKPKQDQIPHYTISYLAANIAGCRSRTWPLWSLGQYASLKLLLNLNQEFSSTRPSISVLQVNESVTLLHPIEPNASPRSQLVLDQSFVFDLEPGRKILSAANAYTRWLFQQNQRENATQSSWQCLQPPRHTLG